MNERKTTMEVQIWSDFACPFCYIGKQQLEAALDQFDHKDEVEIVFKSFELDPNAPKNVDYDVHDMLVRKYGMSRSKAIAMNDQLKEVGEKNGIDFQFDPLVLTNTFDAHRLAQFATSQGKGESLILELFKAYFTDAKHLGDHQTLIDIAEKVGLNTEEVEAILKSDEFADDVRANETEASKLGVSAVPFFKVNNKYAIKGAQSTEVFLNTLQTAWKEEEARQKASTETTDALEACGDGFCVPTVNAKK
ncbi:DsbA family oxidoreductase [Bacillus sp. NPDC077027]|uniref:DsbA family oxidoreductase n=1 Tax=Bacillus sp. NPDC077027 TaxID=3390548 RepID=UPI003D01D0E6